jgi:LruC domain-containing protein
MFYLQSIKYHFLACIYICLSILYSSANAAPFESCPSKAFLMQQTVAQLYGVNLATGSHALISGDLGTTGKINAVGFNFHDNYIYGWGYEWSTIVRIGDDYQATQLSLQDNPGVDFYVGDVSVNENSYYFYRKGSTYGLYKASLDDQSSDYLKTIKIIDGASLSLSIYDFAFHPSNNFLYTVDSSGRLYKIAADTGIATLLGNVGTTGTFGAVYFDVDGKLYISRNNDGYIYIIDVADSSPQAELFAYGPAASQNDGARCAIAPVIDESVTPTTDYGDAPDSYGTTLFSNGARHSITGIYLGAAISAEHNAKVYPKEDEDDGVIFITPLLPGTDSLIQVQTTGAGYLNIWGDWDMDGQFSAGEKLVTDKFMDNSNETFLVNTPISAINGFTWVRARFSATPSIIATGGISDGEVEDYRVLVSNAGNSQIQDTPYYIAFEDSWPEQGDYDMNDVVILQNSSLLLTESFEVKQIEFQGELKALGASYRNGFAIQLDNILPSNVNPNLVSFEINGISQSSSAIETGTQYLVIKITDDLSEHIQFTENCAYYKTVANCLNSSQMTFTVTVPFITPIALNQFPQAPYNPFIFAKGATYHGDLFFQPGRGLEIHLKNKIPTSKADPALFGLGIDTTQVETQHYYQTANGLPWALAINPAANEEWKHPIEMIDIIQAYPNFQIFVETDGNKETDWFSQLNAINTKLY